MEKINCPYFVNPPRNFYLLASLANM